MSFNYIPVFPLRICDSPYRCPLLWLEREIRDFMKEVSGDSLEAGRLNWFVNQFSVI